MAKEIVVPQIGQDIETGILQDLYIKEGDYVNSGDLVASVESDKATFDIEAYDSGYVIKIMNAIGDEVRVMAPLIYLGDKNESVEQGEAVREEENGKGSIQEAVRPVIRNESRLKASPLAKRIARDNNIDLAGLKGSGPEGRIVKRDVLQEKDRLSQLAEPEQIDASDMDISTTDQKIHLSPMRRKIAERLEKSKRQIPHFYVYRDVDVTSALLVRAGFNQTSARKISINDMVVKAVALALSKYPLLNAHYIENEFIQKDDINIGIAVSVEDGLLVPVIPHANKIGVAEIAELSEKIISEARQRIIRGNQTATFTVSNLGMYGIELVLPIINPPECGILGVGAIEKRIVPFENNSFGVRELMKLSLACDHRVIDGVYAAGFLNEVKSNLEHFIL